MTRDDIAAHCHKYKYSYAYEVYWAAHRTCEVDTCNLWSSPPHHIRTQGAGGDDDPANLLALCTGHHTGPMGIHPVGVVTFGERHPELADKLRTARERPRVSA